jgi:hypothetical protein
MIEGNRRPTPRWDSPEEKVTAVWALRAELGTEHGTAQRVASQRIKPDLQPGR